MILQEIENIWNPWKAAAEKEHSSLDSAFHEVIESLSNNYPDLRSVAELLSESDLDQDQLSKVLGKEVLLISYLFLLPIYSGNYPLDTEQHPILDAIKAQQVSSVYIEEQLLEDKFFRLQISQTHQLHIEVLLLFLFTTDFLLENANDHISSSTREILGEWKRFISPAFIQDLKNVILFNEKMDLLESTKIKFEHSQKHLKLSVSGIDLTYLTSLSNIKAALLQALSIMTGWGKETCKSELIKFLNVIEAFVKKYRSMLGFTLAYLIEYLDSKKYPRTKSMVMLYSILQPIYPDILWTRKEFNEHIRYKSKDYEWHEHIVKKLSTQAGLQRIFY